MPICGITRNRRRLSRRVVLRSCWPLPRNSGPNMPKQRLAVLGCLPLALAMWSQPAAADGPVAAPNPAIAVRQGFSPYGIALTRDGRYAYLSFDLSAFVFKLRLSDMTVV